MADELDHAVVVLEIVQAFADVTFVKGLACCVGQIIKLLGKENALVAGKVHRFGEAGPVDVVGRAPRAIGPMRARLNNIVLEEVLVEQHQALLVGQVGVRLEPSPIPAVPFCQIILAQAVIGPALPASGERQFVEGSPDVAVHAPFVDVVVAAAVVPEGIVVVGGHESVLKHLVGELLQVISQARARAAGNPACEVWHADRAVDEIVLDVAVPPVHAPAHAQQGQIPAHDPTVLDGHWCG